MRHLLPLLLLLLSKFDKQDVTVLPTHAGVRCVTPGVRTPPIGVTTPVVAPGGTDAVLCLWDARGGSCHPTSDRCGACCDVCEAVVVDALVGGIVAGLYDRGV